MWDWNTWGGWFGGMTVMMLWIVLFWGGLIALVAWLIVRLTRRDQGSGASGRRTPLDIAQERYAKGEITREQFEQVQKDLSL